MYKDFNIKHGRLTQDTDVSAIKNSIKNTLLTRKGSVPGIPEYGSDLELINFSQMDYLTKELAKRYVRESLSKFEPRINIESIEVKNEEAFNRVLVDIKFRYVSDNRTVDDSSLTVSINY